MKKSFLFILLLILLTGCNSKEESIKIKMDCNNEVTTHTIQKGDVLGCKLLGKEYKITINSATSDKTKIKVDSYGLTDGGSLLDKKDNFEFNKDKELILKTQSTDYHEKLILSYES